MMTNYLRNQGHFTYVWVNHPDSLWMNWVFGMLFGVALLLPVLGVLASRTGPAIGSPLHPTQQG
jgi:hypothetical protein